MLYVVNFIKIAEFVINKAVISFVYTFISFI